MITVSMVTLQLAMISTLTSMNPAKMSIMMIMMSALTTYMMSILSGSNWFPLLFYLLFMGGILVVFMILSSIMPNEKMKKNKKPFLMILIMMIMLISITPIHTDTNLSGQTKWFMQSSTNIYTMIIIIAMYFFSFILIISNSKSNLRIFECHKKKYNFVNYKKKMTMMKMSTMRKENVMTKMINNSLWDLPSPSSMSYFWNFGSTLGICLGIQITSGLFLTFHYTSYSEESFNSIFLIMREVWSGWLVRYIHMNGASMFFLFIYLHLFRGMFFLSATHKKVWTSGVMIMIILMAISFLGYVLPWGQMSYWAVAVITNLFSVIPLMGNQLVNWIWGGFSVSNPTLTRFYSLHFILPFILTFMVIIHLYLLHLQGSSNSMGLSSNLDKIEFHPYFSVKDLYFIILSVTVFMMISFYAPYLLGDAVNNIPANSMQTPIHIQPEWYFLTSYAILRALPSKTTGVMALALSVAVYFTMTLFTMKFSTKFSWHRYFNFWMIILSFMFLMKMGSLPAEEPFILMSKISSMIYFTSIFLTNF